MSPEQAKWFTEWSKYNQWPARQKRLMKPLLAKNPALPIVGPRNEMNLSPEQYRAVNSDSKTILALAGPGSGKSRCAVERIRRLVTEGVPPEQIAAISFTNAASNVLQERLGDIILGANSTLHSFLFRLLTSQGGLVGLNPPLTVIDEEQREELLLLVLEETAWRGGTIKSVREEVAKGPDVKRNGSMSKQEIVAAGFYQKLRDESVLTFDMVLFYGLKLMQRLRQTGEPFQFRYLVADEYQDSSLMDANIYEAMPVTHRYFTGDANQAVFSFRGGRIENIVSMATAGDVETIPLEGNYRCSKAVCEVANRLIEHDATRIPIKTVSLTGQTGQVVVQREGFETAGREMVAVANDITSRKVHGVELSGCAVLLRTNALVAEWTKALQGYGVQVRERKKHEWPEDWARAKATLSLLHNPDNDRLAYAAIRSAAGKEKADEVRRAALTQFKTINEIALRLPYNLPIPEALTQLARMNVSLHSLELMKRFASLLMEGSGIADLVLAMGREEVREETGDGVIVTTFHAMKGREAEAVWLPALEEGYFPCKREEPDESRRLLYVGITRAKNYLWLSWSQKRTLEWEGQVERKPSRFLKEATA